MTTPCPKCGNALGAATAICRLCGHVAGSTPPTAAPRPPQNLIQLRAWCLDHIGRGDRAALMLRWADGLADAQIAKVLGLAPGFVTETLRGIEERIGEISQEVAL